MASSPGRLASEGALIPPRRMKVGRAVKWDGSAGRASALKHDEFRPHFFRVAMKNRHAAFEGEALFARVAGIEKEHAADGFAKRLVRVAEHDDGRSVARET